MEFKHTLKIFVPSVCICGEELPEVDLNEIIKEIQTQMSDWFGGYQNHPFHGGFNHEDGRNTAEGNCEIKSYATEEAFDAYKEDFTQYVADLANRLTQEVMLCEIDGKGFPYPASNLPNPHQCMGGAATGQLPKPLSVTKQNKLISLQSALQNIQDLSDARHLFCRVLNYHHESTELATLDWPEPLQALLATNTLPKIIAGYNGFKIIHLQLAAEDLRKGEERKLIQRIRKDDPTLRALFVVSNLEQDQWHLINTKDTQEASKTTLHLRFFRIGKGQQVRTAAERLHLIDIEALDPEITAQELQEHHNKAFDVESVSQDFFNEISNWYFWALSQVEFPQDTALEGKEEKHRATSLIRFLTRIIFCWFLKEKGLIPESLFNRKELEAMLVDLDDDHCTYHQGILQNLFFATLNQRMGKDSKTGKAYRAFAKDEGFPKNKSTYGVDTLYRYEEHFREPDKALSHFADIPFLNGGLFECLDRTEEGTGRKLYVDGFSRNKKKRARVPNHLFLAGEQTVDLSEAYGDTGRRNARVRGLLRILHAYNFTVEENTPIDEEIALDPELLGKVFENLLASYNEETKTTARKQTGSFYTPRPIVEYMVDESLKAHLCGTLTKLGHKVEEAREQLDLLLGYTDEEPSFSEEEIDALLAAIHTCKILDPACGSGAFPIGMLQKLVHIGHKLDPGNTRWKQLQIDEASKIPDTSARNAAIKAIERDFEENGDDYGRKLYLIENCLYGVDIQPIAIQISKLRFFISLICDQKTNRDKAKNHGIRALPNLETKFVAADTLIGLPEMDQMALVDPRVNKIESEIESLYHRHFSVQRRDQKLSIQRKLMLLRQELGQVLSESLGSSQKAKHLADWDPFDSQSSAGFFDPHWMFGRSLAGGFDIVFGNPPWGAKLEKSELNRLLKRFPLVPSKTKDSYLFFICRSIELLKEGGVLALIIPNTWLLINSAKEFRKHILSLDVREIIEHGDGLFAQATVESSILILSNQDLQTGCCRAARFRQGQLLLDHSIDKASWTEDSFCRINVELSSEKRALLKKIKIGSEPFENSCVIVWGIKPYQVGHGKPPQTRDMVSNRIYHADHPRTPDWKPLLVGSNIDRYSCTFPGNLFIKYGDGLMYASNESLMLGPKILMRQTSDILRCCLDDRSYYCQNSVFIVHSRSINLHFLLGLLNSNVLGYAYKMGNPQTGKVFAEIKPSVIKELPIKCIDDSGTRALHDRIIEVVAKILEKRRTNPGANIEALEKETNKLVYSLYNLSSEEIAMVEATAK